MELFPPSLFFLAFVWPISHWAAFASWCTFSLQSVPQPPSPHACHSRPSPALCLFQDPQPCPSDGSSCEPGICQTTLRRNRGWGGIDRWTGGSAGEKRRGRRNGPQPVCLWSVGTSCVSHFLSTIKVNELVWFVFLFPFGLSSLVRLSPALLSRSRDQVSANCYS